MERMSWWMRIVVWLCQRAGYAVLHQDDLARVAQTISSLGVRVGSSGYLPNHPKIRGKLLGDLAVLADQMRLAVVRCALADRPTSIAITLHRLANCVQAWSRMATSAALSASVAFVVAGCVWSLLPSGPAPLAARRAVPPSAVGCTTFDGLTWQSPAGCLAHTTWLLRQPPLVR